MENASKALIMGAEILMGIIVLSIIVYLFVNLRQPSEAYQVEISKQEIIKFNSYFDKYLDSKDITIQDIVSVINYAQNYNNKYEAKLVEVWIGSKEYTLNINYLSQTDRNSKMEALNKTIIDIIKDYTYIKNSGGLVLQNGKPQIKKYSCPANLIQRDTEGMIKKVVFKEL